MNKEEVLNLVNLVSLSNNVSLLESVRKGLADKREQGQLDESDWEVLERVVSQRLLLVDLLVRNEGGWGLEKKSWVDEVLEAAALQRLED